MFIKMTEHFKGSFPVDIGGVVFGGRAHKQVGDAFGALLVKQNFPRVARCDADGRYLDPVPPVPTPVVPKPVEPVEPEQVSLPAASGADAPDAGDGEVEGSDEVQPTIEPVDDEKPPKGKKKK